MRPVRTAGSGKSCLMPKPRAFAVSVIFSMPTLIAIS